MYKEREKTQDSGQDNIKYGSTYNDSEHQKS